jgi:hypothetical protein
LIAIVVGKVGTVADIAKLIFPTDVVDPEWM